MSIFDIYSKRRKRELGEIPDVYQYAYIPNNAQASYREGVLT
jgi:hypothetical protein